MRKMFHKIYSIRKATLIMCRNYNLLVDYKIDTTSKSKRPLPMLPFSMLMMSMMPGGVSTRMNVTTLLNPPDIILTCALT